MPMCDICHKSKVTYCVRVDRLKGSNFEWQGGSSFAHNCTHSLARLSPVKRFGQICEQFSNAAPSIGMRRLYFCPRFLNFFCTRPHTITHPTSWNLMIEWTSGIGELFEVCLPDHTWIDQISAGLE